MRSVYIEKCRCAWNVFELKGEVLKKPQYQEKKRVQMTFHTEVNLIVGLNVKVEEWSLQLWTQFMQLLKKPEKIQDFNGIWTSDRCDALTNWVMNPLMLGASPQLCVLVFTWWDECDVYEINYITTAEMKLERNLCNCVRSLTKSKNCKRFSLNCRTVKIVINKCNGWYAATLGEANTQLKLFVAAKLCVSRYILLVDHESAMTTKLGASPWWWFYWR